MKNLFRKSYFFLFFIIFTAVFSRFGCFATDLYKNNSNSIVETLSTLEKQYYSKTYDSDDFYTRIDRLENTIYGKKIPGSINSRTNSLDKNIITSANNQNSTQIILELLENRFIGGIYPDDSFENRISRLEKTVFNQVYNGDINERFENLLNKVPVNFVGVVVSGDSGTKSKYVPKFTKENTLNMSEEVSQMAFSVKTSPKTLNLNDEPDDYFEDVLKNRTTINRIKWNVSPVYIFIQPTLDIETINAVQTAVHRWKKYYNLDFTTNPQEAGVIINWSQHKTHITEPVISYNEGEIYNQIIIRCGNYVNKDYFTAFLTHQLGHSIGIWGHSSNRNDIMFPFIEFRDDINISMPEKILDLSVINSTGTPSERDVRTLEKIYSN